MRSRPAALLLALASLVANALEVVPPPYQSRTAIEGVVRIRGSAEIAPVVDRWIAGFRRSHPQVTFEAKFEGSDVAMAGLYTAQSDIAIIGRPATSSEVKAFEWIYRYPPLAVEIATGALATAGRSPALVAYVREDNPLARLSLAELDAIFSRERLRGAPRMLTRWGDLGLDGGWASHPINLYVFDTESGSGRFFRDVVLKDSRMLDWDRITEFGDTSKLRDPSHDAGRRILDALSRDRFGLAVASGPPPRGVRAIALAADDGIYRDASEASVRDRTYPLARAVYAYVNRKPNAPLDAPTAAFLRYALGPEGRRDVEEAGAYLPLEPANTEAQAAKLR